MNYLRYWSLLRKPFLFQQSDDFFTGVPQREALAGLGYFVGCQDNLALLVCPDQNGLTWLLSHAEQMRGFGDQATELISTQGVHRDPQRTKSDLCRAMGFEKVAQDVDLLIDEALKSLHQQDVGLVWLLDRCHPDAALIAQEITSRHENLSVILGCNRQSARQAILRLGRCPMQFELSLLSVDDSCEYVQYCIERAGGDLAAISDNTAVRLHEVTGGVIGQLANAAESALALAASHQMETVTPAVVEAFAERQRRAA